MVTTAPPTVAMQLVAPMRLGDTEHPAGAVVRVGFELAAALIGRRARLVETRHDLGHAFMAYMGAPRWS
jgi:hypothetical protein